MQLLQHDHAAVDKAVCLLLYGPHSLLVQLRHQKVARRGPQGLAHPPLIQGLDRLVQRSLKKARGLGGETLRAQVEHRQNVGRSGLVEWFRGKPTPRGSSVDSLRGKTMILYPAR